MFAHAHTRRSAGFVLILLSLTLIVGTSRVQGAPGRSMVSLQFRNADIQDVLKTISAAGNVNIVASKGVQGAVTVFVDSIDVMEALSLVVEVQGFAFYKDRGVVRVVTAEEYEIRFGKPFKDRTRTKVVTLKQASAESALKSILQLRSRDGKVIADQRSNSLILVDVPEILRSMESVIGKIDVPLETQALNLRHASVQSIEPIVKALLSSGGKVEVDAELNQLIVMDSPDRLRRVEELVRRTDVAEPSLLQIFAIQYAKAEDVAARLKDELTPGLGSVSADKATNKVFITDLPDNLPYIRQLIKELDQKTREVVIEAKIIQIALNDNFKMGVDWQAMSSRFGGANLHAAFRVLSDSDPGARLTATGYEKGSATITALIQALHGIGKTDLLSNPRITCVDGQEARILVGSSIPYKTFDYREDQGVLKTFEKVITVEVGVKLNVTPTINDDGFITIKIRPEVSDVTSYVDNLPIIEKTESETTVMVKDGVTIIIGGLIKDQNIVTENRIPLLGRIPILGFPFRNKTVRKQKTELVILLRPQVITGDEDYNHNRGM